MKKRELIDHGFYRIDAREASKLCGGKLPKWGHEKLVQDHDGEWCWISRTRIDGKNIWSIRSSKGWKMVDGVMTLGGD